MDYYEQKAITLQDLRAIIHQLKMGSISNIEEDAQIEINDMIRSLPGPEQINGIADNLGAIEGLKEKVGGILRLIEIYSRRNQEYKTRYKAKTGLPPRYKVLDWRSSMNKKDMVKRVVQASADADSQKLTAIASDLIGFAKDLRDNDVIPEIELASITAKELDKISLFAEADAIRKVAQTYELGMDDLTGGLNQLYTVIDNVIKSINRKNDQLVNVPTAKNVTNLLGQLWVQLGNFRKTLDASVNQLQQMTPQIEQAMEESLPKSVFDATDQKTYPIEWIDDPSDPEGMIGVVTKADGNQYEVQRDNSGRMSVAPNPLGGAPAAAPAEAPAAAPETAAPAAGTPEAAPGYTPGAGGTTPEFKGGDFVLVNGTYPIKRVQKINPDGSAVVTQLDGSQPKTINLKNVEPATQADVQEALNEMLPSAIASFNLMKYRRFGSSKK